MADQLKNRLESSESPKTADTPSLAPDRSSPEGVADSRQEAVRVLGEGADQGEMVEAEGNVSEFASESGERQGDGMPAKKKKKDDASQQQGSQSQQGDDDDFVFDEKNLPEAPVMIQKIEKKLRNEINELQKEAKKYQGGWFRKADYTRYSETVSEIRKKNVILSKLVRMAKETLQKLFIQMFKPKDSAQK